jgi:hypothetical protein
MATTPGARLRARSEGKKIATNKRDEGRALRRAAILRGSGWTGWIPRRRARCSCHQTMPSAVSRPVLFSSSSLFQLEARGTRGPPPDCLHRADTWGPFCDACCLAKIDRHTLSGPASRELIARGELMKQIAIVMLGLSVMLPPPAAAQSTVPGAQSAAPLPTVKVKPLRKATIAAHTRAGQGTHRTAGYEENDITAAKFGSKHWWTVQGWQSGGSSGNPR